MNYFLALVILGLCGGGYFEYTQLQQNSAADQQQVTDLSAKVDALQAENKKLEDDKAQLIKSVANAQAEMTDLTKQVQTAQSALTSAQAPAAMAKPPVKTTAPVPSNNLGTIVTLDGKTFPNCQLLKVQAEDIVIAYSGGITQIAYAIMPPLLQKRFGYDAHQTTALTEAQTEFQEEERKAAAQAGGN